MCLNLIFGCMKWPIYQNASLRRSAMNLVDAKRNMRSIVKDSDYLSLYAQRLKKLYDELIKVGFDNEQAMQILVAQEAGANNGRIIMNLVFAKRDLREVIGDSDYLKLYAQRLKKLYDAQVAVGFDSEQAMRILVSQETAANNT